MYERVRQLYTNIHCTRVNFLHKLILKLNIGKFINKIYYYIIDPNVRESKTIIY